MTEEHPEDFQPEPEPDVPAKVTLTAEATVTHPDGSEE